MPRSKFTEVLHFSRICDEDDIEFRQWTVQTKKEAIPVTGRGGL
jgi:hypothetical protein